jgi:O-antigen ligase
LIAATISAFIAPHPHVAWGYWKAMVVEPIIYALTLFFLVEKDKRAKGVVWALLLGGLVNVALSLFSMGFGVDFGRFRGIYDVPNSLALIVAPLLTMSIIGGLLSWQPVPPTRWSKVAPPRRWYRVLALIFGAVLLATQSLAGLIAVAVTVLGVVIYLKKGWKILITVGLIIVLGFGLQFSSGKLLHLLSRQSSSFIAREQIWYTAFQMIKKHPILGTGLGTFEPSFQDELKIILNSQNLLFSPYSPHPPLEWVVRDPHNVILSFWLNTGFLGMLAMVVLIVNKLTKTVQALREAKNIHQVLLGVALVTLIIFGLFDVPYWKNDLALIWWVLLM